MNATASDVGFPQGRGVVVDRAGLPVDCSGPVWILNYPGDARCKIDWSHLAIVRDDLKNAIADFTVSLIRTHSPVYARTAFNTLVRMLGTRSFMHVATTSGAPVGFEPFEEIRVVLGWSSTYLHHYRMWYLWCARREYPGFDRAVADRLREVSIGNDPKGRAVLSDDPAEGPLTDLEMAALANALRAADVLGTLTDQQSAALWLTLALGANPLNLTLLREEDYAQLRAVADHVGSYASYPAAAR
ncbi:hypothetical protein, partial [Methylorubrum thiocyanatum]|uniref:hypothetical protein n=1 Tax=Methylorubrum thiocyanatum TaxID=47958 RepID=UPI0035C87759